MSIPNIKTEVDTQTNNKENMILPVVGPIHVKKPIFDGSTNCVIHHR